MLSAAAGAYYYLRLVVVMYLRPAKEEVTLGGGWPVAVAVGFCAGLTLFLGLYSRPIAAGRGRPPTRPWTIRICPILRLPQRARRPRVRQGRSDRHSGQRGIAAKG